MSEYADGFDDGKGEKFDELMEEIVALRKDAERYGRAKRFLQYGNGTLDARGTDSAKFDALIDALPKEEGEMSDGTTHWAGCSESGAKHYKCALLEISRLRDTVTDLRNKLEKKTWFSAYEKKPWVGLTDEEWQEIADNTDIIIWSKLKEAVEAKLKEKNGG